MRLRSQTLGMAIVWAGAFILSGVACTELGDFSGSYTGEIRYCADTDTGSVDLIREGFPRGVPAAP
jgi:hypothetical protein